MFSCTLKSVSGLPTVPLADRKATTIGRSSETKIKNTTCSRNQVEVTPDCTQKFVTIKQVGPNESGINGKPIGHGLRAVANDKDIINVLLGDSTLNYQVIFTEKTTLVKGQAPLDEPVADGVKCDRKPTKRQAPQDVSEAVAVADGANCGRKPVKIPKMFLPRQNRPEDFAKDLAVRNGNWEQFAGGKVLAYASGDNIQEPKTEIFAFDMDGTLITTKSGRVFPKDEEDWKFLYDSTVAKLKTHFSQHPTQKFVIITNQAWMESSKKAGLVAPFKRKIEKIVQKISIPTVVFLLTGKNEFRKPLPAVWNLLIENFNGGVIPDKELCMYCGDAAGRRKDHSYADRFFAENLGIPFRTPEEFFLGQKPQAYLPPKFDIRKVVGSIDATANDHVQYPHLIEMVIMVGFPASGKSSFVKSQLVPKGYIHVSRDVLKSAAKCKEAADQALENGQCVVIDNTNPTVQDRQAYVQIAKKHGVPVRCFVMNIDRNHAIHNNKFREVMQDQHERVPELAIITFGSKYQEPLETEGFSDVVKISFLPTFDDETRKQKYLLHMLEK